MVLLGVCFAAAWTPHAAKGRDIVYEVGPQVAVPYGYLPEQSRLIDLLEQLLLSREHSCQAQLSQLQTALNQINDKLQHIQQDLLALSCQVSDPQDVLLTPSPAAGPGGATYGSAGADGLPDSGF
jgi:rRNA pseudouridine-1189 N-methylase Emg1 (Nep1/Mra1 family)